MGLRLPGPVVGAETKIFVRLVRVDELAGVHAVGGVEDVLEGAEGLHQLFAEHLGQERSSGLAVAVFSGERTAVSERDVGGAIDELAEFENAGWRFEVEVKAHVDAALTEMTVHCARVVVFLHECGDGAEVTTQLRWVDGSVLPTLPASADSRDEGGGT